MSSAVYLEFEDGIELRDWELFCGKNNIQYSPQIIGRNVFHDNQVEIVFGRPFYKELPLVDGRYDFNKVKPRSVAYRIVVSSYYMRNLAQIVGIAEKILTRFGGTRTCDTEFVNLIG